MKKVPADLIGVIKNRDVDAQTWTDFVTILSRDLIADIERRYALERQGESQVIRRGLCYPPGEIGSLVCEMIWRCANDGRIPPRALAELVSTHISGPLNAESALSEFKRRTDHIKFRLNNPNASLREAAKYVGVDHKTIKAWDEENLRHRDTENGE